MGFGAGKGGLASDGAKLIYLMSLMMLNIGR